MIICLNHGAPVLWCVTRGRWKEINLVDLIWALLLVCKLSKPLLEKGLPLHGAPSVEGFCCRYCVCVCIWTRQVLKLDDLKLFQLHKVLSKGYHNLLPLFQA